MDCMEQKSMYAAELYSYLYFFNQSISCCCFIVASSFPCRADTLQHTEWLSQHLLPQRPTVMGKQTNNVHKDKCSCSFWCCVWASAVPLSSCVPNSIYRFYLSRNTKPIWSISAIPMKMSSYLHRAHSLNSNLAFVTFIKINTAFENILPCARK